MSSNVSIKRNPFPAKNHILKILQSTYFAYKVGIIGSYSNRICHQTLKQIAMGSPLDAANKISFCRVSQALKGWETLGYI